MSEGPNQRVVTELKVSGHLMALDAGVFCVFHAPGSQPPDPQSGLPGVRLSLPPGQAAGEIAISTFRDDGWIGGSDNAALIRVDRGPAQVLVTIYQSPEGTHEAPRLQVVKLTEAPAAAEPTANSRGSGAGKITVPEAEPAKPASAAISQETAEVAAHIQGRGDVLAKLDDWMGERGSRAWIEGFAIAPRGGAVSSEEIEYQAVLGRGWLSPWAEGGKFCGSRGMGLPILGLSVRLKGEAAKRYECRLQASFVDGTTASPIGGEPCQTESMAPLEAFHVDIVPRGSRRAEAQAPFAAANEQPAMPNGAAAPPARAAAKPQPVARKPAPAKPAVGRQAAAKPTAVNKPARAAAKPAPARQPAGKAKPPMRAPTKAPSKTPVKPGGRSGRR